MGVRMLAVLVCAAPAWCQIPAAGSIAAGEVRSYGVDLQAGQTVRMFIVQTLPFEVTVKLAGPDGQTVVERTSRQNVALAGSIAAAGRYRLEIAAPKSGAGSGSFAIEHVEIRPRAPEDEALLDADAAYSEYRRRAAAAPRDAAGKLEAAAALYGRVNDPYRQGWTLFLLGQYGVVLSDYQQAANRYAAAAAAFQSAGAQTGRATALEYLGDISVVLREYPKAIEATTEALALSRQEHLDSLEAASLSVLGRAYARQGEMERALDFSQQAVALARKLGDHTREAAALVAAAELHHSLGSDERAVELYQQALPLERELKAPLQEAAVLSNLGSSYAAMHQPARAVPYFEQAIALFRSTPGGRAPLATTLSAGGQAYLETRQPAKAIPLFDEALAIARDTGNRWSEAYALVNLAQARRETNDLTGAAALLSSAAEIQREIGDPRLAAVTHIETARTERARGNLEAARQQTAAAIGLMESLRNQVAVPDLRSSLLASVGDYYQLHVDILMQLYQQSGAPARLEEARDAAERGRARNLVDVLTAARVTGAGSADAELAAREKKLRGALNDLSARRSSLFRGKSTPQQVAAIDRQIEEAWTEYQSVRSKLDQRALALSEPPTLNLNAVQREALDPGTVILEYSLGTPRSYAWAVSQDTLRGFELPAGDRIEEAARAFWEALKSGAEAQNASRRLSQMVLAPARDSLAGKRLLIVADGALQYVPFGALADPAAPGHLLIEAHEVVNEPSASTLALLRRDQAAKQSAGAALAVFADPVFEKTDPRLGPSAAGAGPPPAFLTRAAELHLARLPATRVESQTIASLVPDSKRWVALGFEANRQAATGSRIADYRILHFATHGVLESERPELSALAFSLYDAQGRPQDGFLRLYEIYNLRLRADLVVLSACQTALGKDIRGEGLVGLARGFMHAGAPRVVASLWKVDDQATGELMRLFYSAMLGPRHLAPAAALRSAQMALARQERWRSPYYWAAFVLEGEWK